MTLIQEIKRDGVKSYYEMNKCSLLKDTKKSKQKSPEPRGKY